MFTELKTVLKFLYMVKAAMHIATVSMKKQKLFAQTDHDFVMQQKPIKDAL